MSRTLEAVAADLKEASEQIATWTERRKEITEEIEALYEAGEAPKKFNQDGRLFHRVAGRSSWDYSASQEVSDLIVEIKMAQEAAQESGQASKKVGAASWRVMGE